MIWYEFSDIEEIHQAIYDTGRAKERKEREPSLIRKVMKNMNLTAQQAMDALEIPAEQQQKYLLIIKEDTQ